MPLVSQMSLLSAVVYWQYLFLKRIHPSSLFALCFIVVCTSSFLLFHLFKYNETLCFKHFRLYWQELEYIIRHSEIFCHIILIVWFSIVFHAMQVWCPDATMFTKKKKSKIQISAPSNFEHRVHTDFDEHEQKFVGLPRQWQSLIEDTAKRPKPFIDATVITTLEPRKVRGNLSDTHDLYLFCLLPHVSFWRENWFSPWKERCHVLSVCVLLFF